MKQIVIVGGGAAGLAAAITAAREAPEARVIVLERLDRVGKKILATGNGRCNLTNMGAGPGHYFSVGRRPPQAVLEGMTPDSVLCFFASLGLLCREEEEGRVYPYCRQAGMVLDVLLAELERLNIEVHCGSAVSSIRREKQGLTVRTAAGETFPATAVILTCGGRAAPRLGSDGSGYALAAALGHSCSPLYPALTAFRCQMPGMAGLKGIRADAGLTLMAGERVLGRVTGELQFTEYGLSGIPAMQLSGRLARLKKGEKCTAVVDLFPDWQQEALFRELKARREGHRTLETLLLGTVHKRLAWTAMKSAGLPALSTDCGRISIEQLRRLAETLKHWNFPVTGVQGWDNAQVTAGGVPLEELVPETLESRRTPGLYLAGELLDLHGDCGGFNLHWAWCSGIRAGKAAAGRTRT